MRVGVDGVLARVKRLDPDALLPLGAEIAVLEGITSDVLARLAHVGDDHTGVRDGYFGHLDLLHLDEVGIDEVRAGQHDLLLQALETSVVHEGLSVLVHVVPTRLTSGDLAGWQGFAFLCGHDAHHVVSDLDGLLELDREQASVDAVGARRDYVDLDTALATFLQKFGRVLEHVAVGVLGEHAALCQRLAVTRLDHAHATDRDGDETLEADLVLPWPVEKVNARGQGVGLDAGLAVHGDDGAVGERLVRAEQHEFFVDDSDTVVWNHDDAEQAHHEFVECLTLPRFSLSCQ